MIEEPKVRLATNDDWDDILDMSKQFWDEVPYDEPFDARTCINTLGICLEQGLMVVGEIEGKVCSFLAAMKAPIVAAKALQATEIAFWVNPEARSGGIGVRMIEEVEKLCKRKSIKYLNMVCLQNSMPEVVEKLYTKLGYNKTETCFVKVI